MTQTNDHNNYFIDNYATFFKMFLYYEFETYKITIIKRSGNPIIMYVWL